MPIYEYFCKDCNAAHEVTQRITDEPLTVCPVCQSKKIRKLISRSSFQLKGSGWYVTDYRGKNPTLDNTNGNSNGNGKAASEPAEKSTGKTESKSTEPKTETTPAATKSDSEPTAPSS